MFVSSSVSDSFSFPRFCSLSCSDLSSLLAFFDQTSPSSLSISSLASVLGYDASGLWVGLSASESHWRLVHWGPNVLQLTPGLSFLRVLRAELGEPLMLLLLSIGVVSSLTGSFSEAIAVFSLVIACILLEVFVEYRAHATLHALNSHSVWSPLQRVLRGGKYISIDTESIVPGDVLLLKPGEKVPADGRLIAIPGEDQNQDQTETLKHDTAEPDRFIAVDESMLTGESEPVKKYLTSGSFGMVFRESTLVSGTAVMLVVHTGRNTRIGRLAQFPAKRPKTELQFFLKRFAHYLAIFLVLTCTLLTAILYWSQAAGSDDDQLSESSPLYRFPPRLLLLSLLSLLFATIPEELPILIKLILGQSALQLFQRHQILVRSLNAAEQLGSTQYILTDKTGTLTSGSWKLIAAISSQPSQSGPGAAVIPGANGPAGAAPKHSDIDWRSYFPLLQHWVCSSERLMTEYLLFDSQLSSANRPAPLSSNSAFGSFKYLFSDPLDRAMMEAYHSTLNAASSIPSLAAGPLEKGQSGVEKADQTAELSGPQPFHSALQRAFRESPHITVISLPFDSYRRRSSCLRRQLQSSSSPSFVLSVKGALEEVLARSSHYLDSTGKRIQFTPQSRQSTMERALQSMKFAKQNGKAGIRLIALATRTVEEKEWRSTVEAVETRLKSIEFTSPPAAKGVHPSPPRDSLGLTVSERRRFELASDLERDLVYLGSFLFLDPIRPGVSTIFRWIQDQLGVQVKLVTGDRLEAALEMGKLIGIGEMEDEEGNFTGANVFIGSQTEEKSQLQGSKDGDSVSGLDSRRDLSRCQIFARVSPMEKHQIVQWHQRYGAALQQAKPAEPSMPRSWFSRVLFPPPPPPLKSPVLFIGEGFNDSLALSSADLGFTLVTPETSVSARESANFLLLNPDKGYYPLFLTIIQGRKAIFNLVSSFLFYFACKCTLLLLYFTSFLAILHHSVFPSSSFSDSRSFGYYFPFYPLHLIVLECFMDLGASTAFLHERSMSPNSIFSTNPAQFAISNLLNRPFYLSTLFHALFFYLSLAPAYFIPYYAQFSFHNPGFHSIPVLPITSTIIPPLEYSPFHSIPPSDTGFRLFSTFLFTSWLISHVLLANLVRARVGERSFMLEAGQWIRDCFVFGLAGPAENATHRAVDENTPLLGNRIQQSAPSGVSAREEAEDRALLAALAEEKRPKSLFSNGPLWIWTMSAILFALLSVEWELTRSALQLHSLSGVRLRVWQCKFSAWTLAAAPPIVAFLLVDAYRMIRTLMK